MSVISNEENCSAGRILLITKTDPHLAMDGGTLRTAAVVHQLRQRGYVVDCVAVRGPHSACKASALDYLLATFIGIKFLSRASLSVGKWFTPKAVIRIRALMKRHEYVASVIEYSHLIPYASLMPLPIVLDMHNIESELLANYSKSAPSVIRRWLASYEAIQMKRIESNLPARISAISVVSNHDRQVLNSLSKQDFSHRLVLASNGVGDLGFLRESERRNTVVFVAHLGWQPNVDAALWLAKEVWPLVQAQLPHFVLQLVGRSPASAVRGLASNSIEVHGDVDDVLDYVSESRVATAPLLAAGGTRLKILEGLACGTPVVATSLGALGLESLIHDGVLEIADTPSEFADKLIRLATSDPDPEPARKAAEPYRWESVLEGLVTRIDVLVDDATLRDKAID